MNALEAKIEETQKQIEANQEEVRQIEKEMADAKKVRDDENAEYLKDKKDDEDASRTVKQATDVLTNFYEENGLMLVQQPGPAGEAPPPPPKTWEDPNYGGKTMESNGIIEILKMVKEDIDR